MRRAALFLPSVIKPMTSAEVGSITRVTGQQPTLAGGGGPCGSGMISGLSILRFGKSLPLLELFETFMITGMIMIMVCAVNHFTFTSMASILKNESGSPASVGIATAAAGAQGLWIAIGAGLVIIGVVLYYLHRRVLNTPS